MYHSKYGDLVDWSFCHNTFCHKYLIVLPCGNILGNFKALMPLYTNLICLALEVCYVILHCCPCWNSFFYCLLKVFAQNFSAFDFFVILSGIIRHMRVMFATHCISVTIFHLRYGIPFLACLLRHTWAPSLC